MMASVTRERMLARSALVGVTLLWGSTFVVVQSGLDRVSPLLLIALRFAIATVVLAAWRPRAAREALRIFWRASPLSIAMFLGLAFQTLGLITTTPSRSAFLSAVGVVFVPMFLLARGVRPHARAWTGAVVAFIGVYALFHPFSLTWGVGDTLTLLGAVFFSFAVVELEHAVKLGGAVSVVIAQTLTMAVLAALGAATIDDPRFDHSPAAWLTVLYLGLVCSAFTFVLMTWGQARVRAAEAAVLYTLEPVVATWLSIAVGRDVVSLQLVLGGALILAAMFVAAERGGPVRSD